MSTNSKEKQKIYWHRWYLKNKEKHKKEVSVWIKKNPQKAYWYQKKKFLILKEIKNYFDNFLFNGDEAIKIREDVISLFKKYDNQNKRIKRPLNKIKKSSQCLLCSY